MDARLKPLVIRRDEKWLKDVLPRVEFMVKEIVKMKKHDNWKVRCQMVEWADRLLTLCCRYGTHLSLYFSFIPLSLSLCLSLSLSSVSQMSVGRFGSQVF